MTKQTILTFDPFRYATEIEAGNVVLLAQPRNRAERIFVNMLAVFNQSVRLTEILGQQDDLYDFKLLGKYLVLEFINFFELSKELKREIQKHATITPLNDQFSQKFDRVFCKHIKELKKIRNTFSAHSDHNANPNDIARSWNYINLQNIAEIALIIQEFVHEVIRSNPSMEVLTVNGPFFDNEDAREQYTQNQEEHDKQYHVGRVVKDYLTQDCESKPNKSDV